VSEQILNGTSAPLGYTVPVTLAYAGKYRTEDKSKKALLTLSTTQKKQNPGSVASYDTQPGNEVGLFYNAPEPTRGSK